MDIVRLKLQINLWQTDVHYLAVLWNWIMVDGGFSQIIMSK